MILPVAGKRGNYLLKNKKQAKVVALVVAVLFLLGIGAMAVTTTSKSYAAEASDSSIGVVDYQKVINAHPDAEAARTTMQGEVEQAKKDFQEKSANMNDQERQDYQKQLDQRLQLKYQELGEALRAKVDVAVKNMAEIKGLSVVFDKSQVVFGGQDITEDVIKKVSKQ